MLEEIKRVPIYGDGIGYVSLLDLSHIYDSNKTMETYVADCASVTRGKEESTNVDKTFKRLCTENCGERGRPFEFCPTVAKMPTHDISPDKVYQYKHDYIEDGKRYTTARTLLLPCITEEDLKKFVVIRGRVPRFVYTHLATHTQLSKMCQTARLGLKKKKRFYIPKESATESADIFVRATGECEHAVSVLKSQGMRPEMANRFSPQTEYVDFIMSGWTNNSDAWAHLIELRTGSWTQAETKEVAEAIKHLITYHQRDLKTDGIVLEPMTAEEHDLHNPLLERYMKIYRIEGVKTATHKYTLKSIEAVAKELNLTVPERVEGDSDEYYTKLYRTCVAVIQLRNI